MIESQNIFLGEHTHTKVPTARAKMTQPDPKPGGQCVWAGEKGTAPGLAPPRKKLQS